MHRAFREVLGLRWLALAGMLAILSGCNFVKVPQGWILSSGWSLEFHRIPFHAPAETTCSTVGGADCAQTPDGTLPTTSEGTVSTTSEGGESAPILHRCEGDLPGVEKSSFLGLLKRRGRLGVCEGCGKMGRLEDPRPAVPATMPVVAKFHPVPTAPAFCPETNLVARVEEKSVPAKKAASGKKSSVPTPPKPGIQQPSSEVIPTPSPSGRIPQTTQAPRELDFPPEPPSWVFTPAKADQHPDPVLEAQGSTPKNSESSTRR